jgi:hypothetical protein
MRKPAALLPALLWVFFLAAGPCSAGSTAFGADPFAPVADSGNRVPQMQNAASEIVGMTGPGVNSTRKAASGKKMGPLQVISPAVIVGKLTLAINDLNIAVAMIFVPLAVFGILASCVILALGCLIGCQPVRRFGWSGLLTSCLGLLVFYGIPVIVGLIQAVAARLA